MAFAITYYELKVPLTKLTFFLKKEDDGSWSLRTAS